jgi:anthranilate synthase component 2
MKILLLDNYDSFTYNLVQIIERLGHEVDVYRNDAISIEDVGDYDKIILSPGPGIPEEAGILKETIATYGATKHIFGVCLGLQAIAEVYGGRLLNLADVYHGIQSEMTITAPSVIFNGISPRYTAGRYHSWVVDAESDLSQLVITSRDADGQIMAAQHRDHQVYGVQYHPESIMTPDGSRMIANFLNIKL